MSCRTKGVDAPGPRGATTENIVQYLRKEQRSGTGCSDGRLQRDFGDATLGSGNRLDEPTSRQDENNARAVAALLAAAAHEEGQTVICATHDPAVIRQADKVVVLNG